MKIQPLPNYIKELQQAIDKYVIYRSDCNGPFSKIKHKKWFIVSDGGDSLQIGKMHGDSSVSSFYSLKTLILPSSAKTIYNGL